MVKTNEMSKLDSSIQYPLLINTNQKFVKKKKFRPNYHLSPPSNDIMTSHRHKKNT